MSDALDRLEEVALTVDEALKYNYQNRVALLVTHSVVAIGIGVSILLYGGPKAFVYLSSEKTGQYVLGTSALVGGLILGLGLCQKRNRWLEAIGMLLICLWDASMSRGFIMAWFQGISDTPYPIIVYLGFTFFLCIHLYTLYNCKFRRLK